MQEAAGTDSQANQFACKHQGCDQTVSYVPTRVPGALKERPNSEPRTRVVYLRCPNGHVHPYSVYG